MRSASLGMMSSSPGIMSASLGMLSSNPGIMSASLGMIYGPVSHYQIQYQIIHGKNCSLLNLKWTAFQRIDDLY